MNICPLLCFLMMHLTLGLPFSFPTDSPTSTSEARWFINRRRFSFPDTPAPRAPFYPSRPQWPSFRYPSQPEPAGTRQEEPSLRWPASVEFRNGNPPVSYPVYSDDHVPHLAENNMRPSTLTSETPPECSIQNFTVLFPPSGPNQTCEKLLERGPCKEGEWLTAEGESFTPTCSHRPCPVGSFLWGNEDKCVSTIRCTRGKSLFVSLQGRLFCLCNRGTVQWNTDEKCYRTYERGPCKESWYLIINKFGDPVCVPNSCPDKTQVPVNTDLLYQDPITLGFRYGPQYECHKLGTQGPCKDDELLFTDLDTLEPICEKNEVQYRQLLRVAAFRCSSGRYRDRAGRCRQGHRVTDFRSLFFG